MDMYPLQSKKRVLYVGAHPDDIEIGSAGSIIKSNTQSQSIKQAATTFSKCETNSGLDFTAEELMTDMQASMKVMGIPWENVSTFNFPNTRLPEFTYEIRTTLEQIRDTYHPNVVYLPSEHDTHQDHVAVAHACKRAFRGSEELRCYEVGATTREFRPNLYVDITEQMDKKVEALMCYSTQLERQRFSDIYWRARATLRGYSVGFRYVEAFEILKQLA